MMIGLDQVYPWQDRVEERWRIGNQSVTGKQVGAQNHLGSQSIVVMFNIPPPQPATATATATAVTTFPKIVQTLDI